MRITVYGLGHTGSVAAACLAAAGHRVTGVDPDPAVVARLARGEALIVEPRLDELLRAGLASGALAFTVCLDQALADGEILWVTFDTPVDDSDHADPSNLIQVVERAFPLIAEGTVVLVSSQLPVGSTARLACRFAELRPESSVCFCCVPENLRLGSAVRDFSEPGRVVVGTPGLEPRARIAELLAPIAGRIEWMSIASAEMTKHGVNAFLAMSVVFANDLSVLCEKVGADAREVARGLTTESRIGPHAYVQPGVAFGGGTLARDVTFLRERAGEVGVRNLLWTAILASNTDHARWARDKIAETLAPLEGRRIAVLGLAYKPGTSATRRSSAIETCEWLVQHGAQVRAFDPLVRMLAGDLGRHVTLCESLDEALHGSDSIAILSPDPAFGKVSLARWAARGTVGAVIDPGGVLADQPVPHGLLYHRVGASGPEASRS